MLTPKNWLSCQGEGFPKPIMDTSALSWMQVIGKPLLVVILVCVMSVTFIVRMIILAGRRYDKQEE